MVLRALAAVIAALAVVPAAAGAPPANLRGFLLNANEAQASPHSFSRTPAFAWNGVAGADRYEFELSTSRSFADSGVVWKSTKITTPLTNVPLTLPWIGRGTSGYAWYARVRAVVNGVKTGWSTRYGFNMQAPPAPTSLSDGPVNPQPGMVRWTPVTGATSYQVVFLYGLDTARTKTIETQATAADLREWYAFHNDAASFPDPVTWRVRAVRALEGTPRNDIPVVSYGKWSAISVANEPALAATPVDLEGTISRRGGTDVVGSTIAGAEHNLVPGYWWSGSFNHLGYGNCPSDVALLNVTCPLFHVYVFTDRDCVNRVHVSDVVGSPAYVPRISDPLKLPSNQGELADAASVYLADNETEGKVFDAGNLRVYAAGTDPDLPAGDEDEDAPRRSGLWDSDWTDTTYWWTVVPAVPHILPDGSVEYQDVGFAQDQCDVGQVLPFAKTSDAVVKRGSGVPYVSGVVSSGNVRNATTTKPAFYGPKVVVAWQPAAGAAKYQVQWSRTSHPFEPAGTRSVYGTQALLSLPDGAWYYRVRGVDVTIPGRQQGMSWSEPQYVRILPRTFVVG